MAREGRGQGRVWHCVFEFTKKHTKLEFHSSTSGGGDYLWPWRGVATEEAWSGVGVSLVVCLRVTEAHHKPSKVEKVSRKTD